MVIFEFLISYISTARFNRHCSDSLSLLGIHTIILMYLAVKICQSICTDYIYRHYRLIQNDFYDVCSNCNKTS